MTKLVRPIRARVVCDVYTCSNIAEFEVGHEFTPAAATHLCRDCLRSVYDEAHKIFAEETSQVENDDTEEVKQPESVVAETVSGQEEPKQEGAEDSAASKTKPAAKGNRAKAVAK